ncbi:MAG TPA: hypothetical protein VNX40_16420 [Mucilaginibacter sp.]|nr:hypothetical protein [Mucilaginibacter sp.]
MVMQQTAPVNIIKRKVVCRDCNTDLDRIRRGFLVRTLLFWLPLKRYSCYRCRRKSYSMER